MSDVKNGLHRGHEAFRILAREVFLKKHFQCRFSNIDQVSTNIWLPKVLQMHFFLNKWMEAYSEVHSEWIWTNAMSGDAIKMVNLI